MSLTSISEQFSFSVAALYDELFIIKQPRIHLKQKLQHLN